jgi:PAS domain S-box-containing protein
MAAVNLSGSYNYALVALSVLIAMFASYAALDLAGRVTAAGGWARAGWLLGGAAAMGTGIWSMHYIGMLAFILPIPVAYHWPTVLLSLLAAILASVVALGVVSREKMSAFRALAGSVLMGAGIASMHYIGMAGMRLPAMCQFNSFLVALSVVFAFLISLAALWITFHFRDEKTGIGWEKLAGAVVMGAAIPVMHYTGMAAASFTPSDMPADLSHAVSTSTLGTAGIAAVTFIVLGLALLTSWVDRRFAAQTLELQEEKLQLSEAYLAEAQRLTRTGSWAWRIAGRDALHLSEEWYRIYGFDPEKGPPTFEERLQRTHPEDRAKWQGAIDRAINEKSGYEVEFRILLPDGTVKYIRTVGHPVLNASGDLMQFVGSATDITERKRAEEALQRSESYLAEAQRLTHTASWAWRVAGREFLHLSEEWYRIYGFDPEKGLPAWEEVLHRIHPGDRTKWQGSIDQAIGKKSDYEMEYRILLTTGSLKYIQTVGHPVLNASGDLVQFMGSATDITERKQAEEALQRSEGYLGEAQRLTHTGSWAWDAATRQSVYWSQENYRLFGFDPEAGIPSDEAFYHRVHSEDRDRVRREVFLEKPDEGSHFDVEFRIVLPDGAIKHVRSTGHPVRNTAGDLLEYVGTSIDVTERKRVDEERERLLANERAAFAEALAAQQRFRDLVNSVEGIVWEADVPSFQFRFISKQAERVLGYPVERWLSEPTFWKDHVHPEDQEWAVEFCQNATAEKSDHEFEYRMIAADGSVVWVRDLVTVVVEGDRVTRVRGVMVDLTNRKLAEEALRQAQADLAHVSRVTTMGELTASLAHEVNQPIAAAVTNANTCLRWLTRDHPNLEEARAAAMRIVKDGTRAGEIISRIRQLFQKGGSQHELVDVNEVIREMIVLLRGETTRYNVFVETGLAADLPQITGDRVQLQQVLMNLMINGIDAMKDADGTRELAIKSRRTENEEVAVSVADSGVGLPPQHAEQIFNAFFSNKPHGIGMGLRISRSIIESHGGRLWAADNSPRGATFCFTLPTKSETHE